jgi:hypothetical protein
VSGARVLKGGRTFSFGRVENLDFFDDPTLSWSAHSEVLCRKMSKKCQKKGDSKMLALHGPALLDELGRELPGNGRLNVGLNDETTRI